MAGVKRTYQEATNPLIIMLWNQMLRLPFTFVYNMESYLNTLGATRADLLKDKYCPGSYFWVTNIRKNNSLNIASFYSNVCTQILYLVIIRSYTVHHKRQIFHSMKIQKIIKKFWFQPKMSGISLKNVWDPRSQDPAF